LAWPSSSAIGSMNSTASEKVSPKATPTISRRLVNQPSAPGHREALRQAKALALWAMTTVMNAAPDAANSACPVGNESPGRQPAATRAEQEGDHRARGFGRLEHEHVARHDLGRGHEQASSIASHRDLLRQE
jgi:hypothetical protein